MTSDRNSQGESSRRTFLKTAGFGAGSAALIAGLDQNAAAQQGVTADASIVYMHADTARAHVESVGKEPDKYWGSFMYCPSELQSMSPKSAQRLWGNELREQKLTARCMNPVRSDALQG